MSAESTNPLVRVWYPAERNARPARSNRDWRQALRRVAGIAHPDSAPHELPLAAGTAAFPLVIYFPGWSGTRIENYGLINELASHGFIVAGVLYPAESEVPMDYSSEAAYRRTQQVGTARVHSRASDAVALIDGLAADGAAPLAVRIDMSRIGIVGFSLGGAVAAEASTLDPRIRAVVNIDGRHWGRALERGVSQPYLFIGEELLLPTEAQLASKDPNLRFNAIEDQRDYSQLAINLRRHGGMQVVVSGARHAHFTDGAARAWRTAGRRVLTLLHAYVLAFFRQTLCSEPSPLLLPGAQPFAEARLQVWMP